jgi:hypothetical protein
MDDQRRISPISPSSGVTPIRPVGPSLSREQIDLFERMVEQGHRHADEEPDLEQVTPLTQAEILQIEDRLPDGLTVAGILGRSLLYHPVGDHGPARHRSPTGHHVVDEDA